MQATSAVVVQSWQLDSPTEPKWQAGGIVHLPLWCSCHLPCVDTHAVTSGVNYDTVCLYTPHSTNRWVRWRQSTQTKYTHWCPLDWVSWIAIFSGSKQTFGMGQASMVRKVSWVHKYSWWGQLGTQVQLVRSVGTQGSASGACWAHSTPVELLGTQCTHGVRLVHSAPAVNRVQSAPPVL